LPNLGVTGGTEGVAEKDLASKLRWTGCRFCSLL
jgi:hypothetical protein